MSGEKDERGSKEEQGASRPWGKMQCLGAQRSGTMANGKVEMGALGICLPKEKIAMLSPKQERQTGENDAWF